MTISKKIEISKLKIKYVLGNQSTLVDYPTSEDILYELIEDWCGRIYEELKFTDVSLKKKYNLTTQQTEDIIEQFKLWGCIEDVLSNSAYTTYKVIKNPFA